MTTGESAPRARSGGLLSAGTWTVQRVRDERIELPRGATGPQAARRAVEQELGPALDAEQSATLQLLVTELVSNAVRYGDGEAAGIVLHLAVAPDRVRIEVCDRGGGFEPQQPAPYGEGGYGLFLVDTLASAWGVASDDGTCVWLELDRKERAHGAD